MSNSRIFVAKMRESDSIKHYGIDGQKWGKRNGPPYPLANVDRSLAERRANTESESSKRMRGAFDENDSDNSNGSRRRDDDPNIVDGEYREVKNENSTSESKSTDKKSNNSRDFYGKNLNDLTDDELEKVLKRRRNEKDYDKMNEKKNKFDSAAETLNSVKKQASDAEDMLKKFADKRDRANGKYNFPTNQMSNEELKKAIDRMDLERRYIDLKSSNVEKGSNKVQKLFAFGMGGLSLAATALGVAKAIKELKD